MHGDCLTVRGQQRSRCGLVRAGGLPLPPLGRAGHDRVPPGRGHPRRPLGGPARRGRQDRRTCTARPHRPEARRHRPGWDRRRASGRRCRSGFRRRWSAATARCGPPRCEYRPRATGFLPAPDTISEARSLTAAMRRDSSAACSRVCAATATRRPTRWASAAASSATRLALSGAGAGQERQSRDRLPTRPAAPAPASVSRAVRVPASPPPRARQSAARQRLSAAPV